MSKLSAAGIKLMNANPDKTPYQLLELGLSQSDYEEMINERPKRGRKPKEEPVKTEEPPMPEVIKPIKVQPTSTIPKPKQPVQALYTHQNNTAVVLYKGKQMTMNRKTAELMQNKYPKQYQIIR